MTVGEIRSAVEACASLPPDGLGEAARAAFEALMTGLEAGTIRAAEPAPEGWRVHAWVKQGILLGFRLGRVVDTAPAGPLAFRDKDTFPTRRFAEADGVRLVPGGSAVRRGAYLGPGVVVMPPAYVNVGSYVGEGSLVDSHALVGSCAQVGRRVHLSAGAMLGGVLEPAGAMPVIVEDEALVGGNTGLYEGAVVKRRAVIGAGTILTGSTPVYDLPNGRILKPEPGSPLVVPERAVVVPGARAVTVGAGREWGLSLATPVIVKYRDEKTDRGIELEDWLR